MFMLTENPPTMMYVVDENWRLTGKYDDCGVGTSHAKYSETFFTYGAITLVI